LKSEIAFETVFLKLQLFYLDPQYLEVLVMLQEISPSLGDEAYLKEFYTRAQDVFWVLSLKNFRFIYVSPSVQDLRGYTVEEVMQQNLEESLTPESFEKVKVALTERLVNLKQTSQAQAHFTDLVDQPHKDGHIVHTEVSSTLILDENGQPDLLLGISRDISHRHNLEHKIAQSKKLESLGLLAASIAHDFNNILTSIQGNLDLALLTIQSNFDAIPYLSNANKAVAQAAHLVRQLLIFTGKAHVETTICDLNSVLQNSLQMFKVLVPPKINLQIEFSINPIPVLLDQVMFQQLMMNFITNAVDAMGDKGGMLRVVSQRQWVGNDILESLIEGQNLKPGYYAVVEVADQGCGMSEELIERIFEPFFSTKSSGRGLGLSSVLGIVRIHHAGLLVSSRVGVGTSFRVYLPLQEESHLENKQPSLSAQFCSDQSKTQVLVVDDEPYIQSVISQMLQIQNYSVELASNGLEALNLLKSGKRFDLILLDLTMPVLDGLGFLEEIKKHNLPKPKIILMSGYHNLLEKLSDTKDFDSYLSKPFGIEGLCDVLNKVLGQQGKSIKRNLDNFSDSH
jgi:PAS domain S-box-containing protein